MNPTDKLKYTSSDSNKPKNNSGRKSESTIHSNHRERFKNRFLSSGFDSFAMHEILECMLFFCIPRIDVNPLAHRLANEYKNSFSLIIQAPFDELLSIPGMTRNAALFFKMVGDFMRITDLEVAERNLHEKNIEENITHFKNYLLEWYHMREKEISILISLNNRMVIKGVDILHEGNINSAFVTARDVVKYALKRDASAVILAHNHPDGLAIPSSDDLMTTHNLQKILENIGITLYNHYIVAEGKVQGILYSNR